jgi:flagellar assembly protein FliH
MVSQIIPKGRLSTYQRWQMDAFEHPSLTPVPKSDAEEHEDISATQTAVILPTVEQIERIHREAQQEGYSAGYEAGHDAGHKAGYEAGSEQAALETTNLQVLLSSFRQALADADQTIGNELLALALDLARQMVREALRVKPELMFAVVRESIREESTFGQPPRLYLHPDDAMLVREHLSQELNDCVICIDPQLERGGCRVRTGNSYIDATLATRWQRIAQALGQKSGWLE